MISINYTKKIQPSDPAIEFYSGGTLTKCVRLGELLNTNKSFDKSLLFSGEFLFSGELVYVPNLSDEMSESDWIKFSERDEKNSVQHFLCKTALGRMIVFDIKTGEIIFDGKTKVSPVGMTVDEVFR
jgi:hypothetical protein